LTRRRDYNPGIDSEGSIGDMQTIINNYLNGTLKEWGLKLNLERPNYKKLSIRVNS